MGRHGFGSAQGRPGGEIRREVWQLHGDDGGTQAFQDADTSQDRFGPESLAPIEW